MTARELTASLRASLREQWPIPGDGQTALRHQRLLEIGREDLSLARLAEAHWDAVAILTEAGRHPVAGALYGVWASEKPGGALRLSESSGRLSIAGSKAFCSGAGLVDRALITVGEPEPLLFDVDLWAAPAAVQFDYSVWKTEAFSQTNTAAATFHDFPVSAEDQVGEPGFYLSRPGFWHGACGPAACWAGGAVRLVDYALAQSRGDEHTLAHLGAMQANGWALRAYLETAGREIDAAPDDLPAARVRARTVRHLVEQAATDVLRRLTRAFGPYPLAMDEAMSRHCQELDIYLRQSHAERDLEALGRDVRISR